MCPNKPPGQSQLEFHMIKTLSIMKCEEASPGWSTRLGSAELHRSGARLYYAEKRNQSTVRPSEPGEP